MKIDIDTSQYRMPTQKEVDDAKKYILRRENYAQVLESRIDTILTDAAGEIAQICLKYNIPATSFTMSSNDQMFGEVSEVMNRVEDEIMALIEQFSTASSNDNGNKKLIALWIATLGRGNMNLQQTLSGYLNRYLYDLEALIASYKLQMEKYPQTKESAVISEIKSAQHSVYSTPAVIAAMKGIAQMQARYIRTHGVHRDSIPLPIVGSSNSNANNVISMATTTMRMAWMREQLMEFRDNGAIGYVQVRSSSIPCPLCDEEVGFHSGDLNAMMERAYPHPNCVCRRIPIYSN